MLMITHVQVIFKVQNTSQATYLVLVLFPDPLQPSKGVWDQD